MSPCRRVLSKRSRTRFLPPDRDGLPSRLRRSRGVWPSLGWSFPHPDGPEPFCRASSGAQQQVNRRSEAALGAYRHDDTARLAQDLPRKAITVTQDETLTGGLCLVTMDPESHCILVEQLAQTRGQARWDACMAPARAQRNGQVRPST